MFRCSSRYLNICKDFRQDSNLRIFYTEPEMIRGKKKSCVQLMFSFVWMIPNILPVTPPSRRRQQERKLQLSGEERLAGRRIGERSPILSVMKQAKSNQTGVLTD